MAEEGGLQHPWAGLAHAQALLAGGDEDGCAAVLQGSLRTFHIADKSAVRFSPHQLPTKIVGLYQNRRSGQQAMKVASFVWLCWLPCFLSI